MSTTLERVEVDFLVLADRAEVLNGKLYMMGGAWDRQNIINIETPISLNIVIGVLVPWNLTNETHQLDIRIEDEDGSPIPPGPTAALKVGRPTQSTSGQSFRAMAVIAGRWLLPKFGAYCVIASISGREAKRVTFYAIDAHKTRISA